MANYVCPACGNEDVSGLPVCACGADLSILAAISGACDAWFNQGLEAAGAGDLPQAMEWFSACCAAAPTDAAPWVAVAKVWLKTAPPARSAARAGASGPDRSAIAGSSGVTAGTGTGPTHPCGGGPRAELFSRLACEARAGRGEAKGNQKSECKIPPLPPP